MFNNSISNKRLSVSKETTTLLLIVLGSLAVGAAITVGSSRINIAAPIVATFAAGMLFAIRFWRRSFWVAVSISGYIVFLWMRNLAGIESELVTPFVYLAAAGGFWLGQLVNAGSSKERLKLPPNIAWFAAFAAMIYLRFILAGLPQDAVFDIQLFSVIVLPVCLALFWHLDNKFWERVPYYFVAFGIVMLVAGAYYYVTSSNFTRFSLNETIDVLGLARVYSYAAIGSAAVGIIRFKQSPDKKLQLWLALSLSTIFLFGIMLTGTRAATLVVPVVIMAMLFACGDEFPLGNVGVILRLALLGMVVAFLIGRYLPETTFTRLTRLTLDEGNVRGDRLELYSAAWDVWKRYPLFGTGVNGYDRLTSLRYPHNSFLESATDFGVIGLFIYTGLIVSTFVMIFKMWRTQQSRYLLIIYTGFFIYALTRAQFSNSIYGSNGVWFFALLIGRFYVDRPTIEVDAEPTLIDS